ncbi:MAG: hypothetical protein ACRC5T_08590 [Cetobacterium sp.]
MGKITLGDLPVKFKRIGPIVWFHKEQLPNLVLFPEILEEVENVSLIHKGKEWNIVKLTNKCEVSLIQCEDFDTDPEPVIQYWLKKESEIKQSLDNPTIFHKRHLMVSKEYKGFNIEEDIARCNLIEEVIKEKNICKNRIGKLKYWKNFLLDNNL